MGQQSSLPAWPREFAPELRSLAETVWRLMHRDSSHAALHMVSRALRELGERSSTLAAADRRAYLLNLRGIVYAQQQREAEAVADLLAAASESPAWHVPLYNLALCHKHARRWREAEAALQRALGCLQRKAPQREPSRPVLWNLGLCQTALGRWDEARQTWRACGVPLGAGDRGPVDLDLGLAQLSLPTKGPYAAERVWVQRLCPARARILSVVRYGAPCQFGDVVLCDEGTGHTGFLDGVVQRESEGQRDRSRDGGMIFLDTLEPAGYTLHVVRGAATTPAQATALTERLREAELHIEVWSLTMRLPDAPPPPAEGAGVPLCAGLVLAAGDGAAAAGRALQELRAAERELGIQLYAPTLMLAAGDEVGAARHRKALQRLPER